MTCPAPDFLDETFLKTVKAKISEQGLFVVNLVSRSQAIKDVVLVRMKEVKMKHYCIIIIHYGLCSLLSSSGSCVLIQGSHKICCFFVKLKQHLRSVFLFLVLVINTSSALVNCLGDFMALLFTELLYLETWLLINVTFNLFCPCVGFQPPLLPPAWWRCQRSPFCS